jgi:capsid assembly protease
MDKLLTMPPLWAILPDQVAMTQHAFMSYLKQSLSVDSKVLSTEANLLDVDVDKMPSTFFMDGQIAIMQINGPITPKADIFSSLFGGATIDVMTRDFKALVADENVKAIVLDIDSPGGVVFGGFEFADLVFESRSSKPIVAISGTMMASLAMLIASAAEDVFITSESVITGSIGTLANHVDVSGLEKSIGIKTTPITAGKFKAIASAFAPLTAEGRADIQGRLDHVSDALVKAIAKFKGVDVKTVNSEMGDGKVFVGSQGIKAGLVDGIMEPDELIDRINASV